MSWTVEFLDEAIKAEMDALPVDMRARFLRIVELIAIHGLERLREPHAKHVEGPLWELRLKGKAGIARALYVTAVDQRIVIVRVFTKKTQKTPRREITFALRRAEEVT